MFVFEGVEYQPLHSYAKSEGFANCRGGTGKLTYLKQQLAEVSLRERIRIVGTSSLRGIGNMFDVAAKRGLVDLKSDPRVCRATQKKNDVSIDEIYKVSTLAAISQRYDSSA